MQLLTLATKNQKKVGRKSTYKLNSLRSKKLHTPLGDKRRQRDQHDVHSFEVVCQPVLKALPPLQEIVLEAMGVEKIIHLKKPSQFKINCTFIVQLISKKNVPDLHLYYGFFLWSHLLKTL